MHEIEDHDRGLQFDLQTLVTRRRALSLFGAAGAAFLVGCAADGASTGAPHDQQPPGGGGAVAETVDGAIPEETAGPYPGDGSNGVNVLDDSGIVRSDISSSFGAASGVAEGIPLTIAMTVTDLDGKPPARRRCGLSVALQSRGCVLDVPASPSPTRTTCAGCRLPMRRGW